MGDSFALRKNILNAIEITGNMQAKMFISQVRDMKKTILFSEKTRLYWQFLKSLNGVA